MAQLENELQQERLESSQQKLEKEKVQRALEMEKRAHQENVASMEAKFKQATSMQLLSATQVRSGSLMMLQPDPLALLTRWILLTMLPGLGKKIFTYSRVCGAAGRQSPGGAG